MAVSWSSPGDDGAEPATPTTLLIIAGTTVEVAATDSAIEGRIALDLTPHDDPEGMHIDD
jgi:hypothetical protein